MNRKISKADYKLFKRHDVVNLSKGSLNCLIFNASNKMHDLKQHGFFGVRAWEKFFLFHLTKIEYERLKREQKSLYLY